MSLSPEDILGDSLRFLGEEVVSADDETICYGPLKLTPAPKAITLLADHLFSPALFLAEQIERSLIPCENLSVIELGAGCALPSLLLSTVENPPSLVLITDYPAEILQANLRRNVERNAALVSTQCKVISQGYDWGTDVADLKVHAKEGFDIMILSDLLHFHDSHDALVTSVKTLLRRSSHAKLYVAAGKYTKSNVCQSFIEKATLTGLNLVEKTPDEADCFWQGKYPVSKLDPEDLAVRKAACRFWVGEWA
ncbi:putative methyltransferase-domain-containing protein [Mycena floridula]|nr:putative methyltransferase-domain-containing protein [Mycena floridula]